MFDPIKELKGMDVQFLLNNGWTVEGNLAYRHILYEYTTARKLEKGKIQEIIKHYGCMEQMNKIKEQISEFIEIKQEIEKQITVAETLFPEETDEQKGKLMFATIMGKQAFIELYGEREYFSLMNKLEAIKNS